MRFRIGLALGFGVGYVLGSKAGRERYDQLMGQAQRLWDSQQARQVREATGLAADRDPAEVVRAVADPVAEESEPVPAHRDGSGNGKI